MINSYDFQPEDDLMSHRNSKIGATARVVGCQCSDCVAASATTRIFERPIYSDYDEIQPNGPGKTIPTEHQYLIFDSHMFGFVLKDREYGMYSMRSPCKNRCVGRSTSGR